MRIGDAGSSSSTGSGGSVSAQSSANSYGECHTLTVFAYAPMRLPRDIEIEMDLTVVGRFVVHQEVLPPRGSSE